MLVGMLEWMLIRLLGGMPILLTTVQFTDFAINEARPFQGRASYVWSSATINAVTLALIDANISACVVASLLLILDIREDYSLRRRTFVLATLCTFPWIGPTALIPGCTAWAWRNSHLRETSGPAVACLLPLIAIINPTAMTNLPLIGSPPLPSFAFLIAPALVVGLILNADALIKIATISWPFLLFVASALLHIGGWWNQDLLTERSLRVLLTILPALALNWVPTAHFRSNSESTAVAYQYVALPMAISCLVTKLLIPTHEIEQVLFDESHGEWESVTARFEPEDFGRDANYAYSLLYEYSGRLVGSARRLTSLESLPDPTSSAIVIKLPLEPYQKAEVKRLSEWVRSGGSLLMIFDHTDLFDTTRHGNSVLRQIAGFEVNSDSVFDLYGNPSRSDGRTISRGMVVIGQNGFPMDYQTGASFSGLPLNARALATYGLSYSEPANYSRPNRFGGFTPEPTHVYSNHPSIVAVRAGDGVVVAIGDSTFWSNFSIFLYPYKELFRAIVNVMEARSAIAVANWSMLALSIATIAMMYWRTRFSMAAAATALGALLASAATMSPSTGKPQLGIDFRLRVVLGSDAQSMFLPQLLQPGSLNFSRIISSLNKWRLDPVAFLSSTREDDLSTADDWLLLAPDPNQLPIPAKVREATGRGIDVGFFFDGAQARDPQVQSWIHELGFQLEEVRSLALRQSVSMQLRDTDKPTLMSHRAIRIKNSANSGWAQQFETPDVQSFRPIGGSGQLHISFAADQFSDASLGDVWEGGQVTRIARARESQMASLFGAQVPQRDSMLRDPGNSASLQRAPLPLPRFLVVSGDGHSKSGIFPSSNQLRSSRSESERALALLQNEVIAFIDTRCSAVTEDRECEQNFVDSNLREWEVIVSRDKQGILEHVELVHPRSFSGSGENFNVLFSR